MGAAGMAFPLVRAQISRLFAVRLVVGRDDAQIRTVLPALAHSAIQVPQLPAVIGAIAFRVLPAAVRPVFDICLAIAAMQRRARTKCLKATTVDFDATAIVISIRLGYDIDYAGRCRIAVQHAPRPFENLDFADAAKFNA